MDMTISPPIKTWSFSAVKQFEKCPYSVFLKRVAKSPVPEPLPDNPLVRGNLIHEMAELFVKGEGPFTHELRKFKEEFDELAEAYANGTVELEQMWWFNSDWEPVPEQAKDKWGVAKLDAFMTMGDSARVIDYKTGKKYGNEVPHTMQAQLYMITAFLRNPTMSLITTEFWYLDTGEKMIRVYDRLILPTLIASFNKRANALTSAIAFPPKANKGNCRFCDFSRNNNGTGICAYGVDYE